MEYRYLEPKSDVAWYFVAPGFMWKSGPGHAWLVLDSNKLRQMRAKHPELIPLYNCNGFKSNFEEDCEYALAVLAFWKILTPEFSLLQAINTVSYYYPLAFNKWIINCVQSGEMDDIMKAFTPDFDLAQRNVEERSTFREWVEVVKEYCL